MFEGKTKTKSKAKACSERTYSLVAKIEEFSAQLLKTKT